MIEGAMSYQELVDALDAEKEATLDRTRQAKIDRQAYKKRFYLLITYKYSDPQCYRMPTRKRAHELIHTISDYQMLENDSHLYWFKCGSSEQDMAAINLDDIASLTVVNEDPT